MAAPRHSPYAVFELASFRWFVASVLSMTIGAQVQAVVVGWQVYQVTHDPLALGLMGLAEVIPYVSMALFAGYVVDRSDRRRVSLLSLTVLLGAATVLLAINLGASTPTRVWPYYVIIATCGVARSFLQTARTALISEIVPRRLYTNAATWRSSTWQLGSVVGPALGGVLFGAFGARVALSVNVVMTAGSLAAMSALRHRPTALARTSGSMARDLADGIHFVLRERVILGALTLDLLAVFFGGAVAMLPVYASDILKAGPQGLGLMQASPGVGAVVMAFIIAHRGPFKRSGPTLLGAVAIFGVTMIAFAVSKNLYFSAAMLVVSGAADNVSAVIRATLIQVLVPAEMLGRVSAVNTIFIGSSNELGAFESGVAARLLGVVRSVVLGGVMTMITVSTIAWKVKEVRTLGEIAPTAVPDDLPHTVGAA
jgi:MFS family permease